MKLSFKLFDIFSVLNRRDNRGICTGSADAFFFERLDKRGLGIAGWWFGKMLLCFDIDSGQCISGLHCRKLRLFAAGWPHSGKTVKDKHTARRAIPAGELFRCSGNFHAGGIPLGGRHLTGNKALPNQIIKFVLLIG